MEMAATLGFIGTGKMSSALIRCIYKNKGSSITASNRSREKLIQLKNKFQKIKLAKNNIEAAGNSDIIFICVKPQDIGSVLEEIKNAVKNKIVVSIAAGIKTGYIESRLRNARVVRIMPNIACLAGEMSGGICAGKKAGKKDIEKIIDILKPAGKLLIVKEELMDIVTAISGSGPAFFAYFIKAFEEAGVKNGLPREIARKLAVQTALGTAKLILENKIKPEELISMVASPKGTTMAGLEILDKYNVKEILGETIEAAVRRSRELRRK